MTVPDQLIARLMALWQDQRLTVCKEAADEITRLREENHRLKANSKGHQLDAMRRHYR